MIGTVIVDYQQQGYTLKCNTVYVTFLDVTYSITSRG